jgi:hypothetical protein
MKYVVLRYVIFFEWIALLAQGIVEKMTGFPVVLINRYLRNYFKRTSTLY